MIPGSSLKARLRRFKYWLRWTIWGRLGGRGLPDVITERVSGVMMRYRLRSGIGMTLYLRGAFEEKEIALLARMLRAMPSRELVIFDVGANIGVHTATLGCMFPQARIVAFEPAEVTRKMLEANILGNGLAGRVVVEPCALSNTRGTAEFFEMDDEAYSSLKHTQRMNLHRKSMVQLETLDHYVRSRSIERVDLVKIDVEGFETEVLEGAMNMLKRMQPDLFVEIYQGTNSNADPARTIRLLTDAGYRGWVVKGGELHPITQHDDRFYNYYFSVRDVSGGERT